MLKMSFINQKKEMSSYIMRLFIFGVSWITERSDSLLYLKIHIGLYGIYGMGRAEVLQSTVNTDDIQYTAHLRSIILNPFLQQTSKYSFLQQIYNMSSIQS